VRLRSTDIDAAACGSSPFPRPRPGPGEMEVKAYFNCDAHGGDVSLHAVYRIVPASPAVLRASLEALVAGPNETERAATLSSWFSAATAGMLRSVTLSDGHAIVDFADLRAVIPNASTSAGSARLLAQLDATVFQFRSVASVEYRIEGSCETFTEWLQLAGCEPRTRSEVSTD
jgi:spore germination protein GerM